jgi:dipeptidyl aminopeptidase/acylaminoacyl peptidase
VPNMYPFESYLNVRSAHGPSFSSDGQRLAFLTNISGVDEVWSVLVEVQAPTPSWPEQLTFRSERAWSVKYSPASYRLLVTGDIGANERNQFYLLTIGGAPLFPLTTQPEVIHQFGDWSPDGTMITFASNARNSRYFDIYEQTVPAGEPTLLFQSDDTNYALRYSPDGRSILFSRVDSNSRNALFLLDRSTGEVRRLTPEISEGHALHESAAWSADRRGLYLLSDRDRQFLSLAWLDLATTEMTYLDEKSWDTEALAVTGDGTRLALVTNEDGYSRLELWDVSKGWEQRQALPGPTLPACILADLTWAPDGSKLAFTLDTANDAPDIWVWDIAEQILWRATRSALGGIPRGQFVTPGLVHYPTFDGRQIPAFLFLPPKEQPGELPVVLYVHGGPESQLRPSFNPILQYLVGSGYMVLAPNVRGSTGYGAEYQSLDDVRLRMDSVADLKYAVEWLKTSGIAHPKRIAIMGRSYGGFMVLAAVTTYPDLWAAAVDIVGIANFVSFLENTGPWRRKLREAEYGSLEHDRDFLEEISPIHKVNRITAPMFVSHGANDPRVPVGEAEQIVAALKARGVPVEYVRFEDEGHQFTKRSNQLIVYPAIGHFLDKHVAGAAL